MKIIVLLREGMENNEYSPLKLSALKLSLQQKSSYIGQFTISLGQAFESFSLTSFSLTSRQRKFL